MSDLYLGNKKLFLDNKKIVFNSETPINPIWNNLLSYYRLDETVKGEAVDSAGSNTCYHSATCIIIAGKNNNAINTSYGYVNGISDNLNFDTTDKFTISMWIQKSVNMTANTYYLLFSRFNNYQRGYALQYGYLLSSRKLGSVFRFSLSNSSTYMVACDTVFLQNFMTNTDWYNVVWIYNGNGLVNGNSIYVNAVKQTNGTPLKNNLGSNTISQDSAAYHYIGGGASPTYYGNIDEVGIWNRELTTIEITELYNNGNGLFY